MAKTTAPLLGFGAAGQIGKANVHASWKGITYTRRYTIPANPNTAGQQATRGAFAWLQAVWKIATADFQAPWTASVKGKPLTNRNQFSSQNVGTLRGATDLAGMIFSPGASSGLAAAAIAVTPGAGQLSVALTEPTLPAGWTIVEAVAVAIKDQNAQTDNDYASFSATDNTAPYACVITGLTAATLYRVGGWFKYDKGDGTFAYGPSLVSSGTPT
jgi:hypothetical protein